MPIKPSKFASKNAQHTLEYVILMTLIMAGIIIGAPYVTRSWNAQMKGWEDSVIDSMNDPLTEAPPDIVSIPGCDFVSWGSCGFTDCCGLGYPLFGKSISCTAQQLLQLGKFKPLGCELSDPSMDFDLIARCDTSGTSSTDPAANHCCTPWVTPSGCNPNDFGCPRDADCGVNVGCPDGQYRHNHVCDEGYPETGCVADPGCNFTCGGPLTGFVPIANATFCSGDDTGLSGDANYVISSSCTPAKCEYVCNPPFVSNGTQCVCPAGSDQYGDICCVAPMLGNATNTACVYPPPYCAWASPNLIHWGGDDAFGCREKLGASFAVANHDADDDSGYDRHSRRQCCQDLSKIRDVGNCQWTGWRKAGNWLGSPANMPVDETQTCRNSGNDYVMTNVDCGMSKAFHGCRTTRIECCQVTNPDNTFLANCQWTPSRDVVDDQSKGCREYFSDQYVAVGFDCVLGGDRLCQYSKLMCCQLITP